MSQFTFDSSVMPTQNINLFQPFSVLKTKQSILMSYLLFQRLFQRQDRSFAFGHQQLKISKLNIIIQPMSQQPISVKLVVVGDGAVGKTCVLTSYTENKFPTEYVPTVFDNRTTTIKIDGRIINLGLWDTAGQEEYSKLRPLAYSNSDIFLIIFSVVDPSSFVNTQKLWYPELMQAANGTPIIFVGNKIDMREDSYLGKEAVITKEAGQKVAEKLGVKYLQCSALTQQGLKNVFQEAMKTVLAKKVKPKAASHQQQKGSGCCLI